MRHWTDVIVEAQGQAGQVIDYFVQELSNALYAKHKEMPKKRLPKSGRKNMISTMLVMPLEGDQGYDLAVQTVHQALSRLGRFKYVAWGGPGPMNHEWKAPKGKVIIQVKPFGVETMHLLIFAKA